MSLENTLQTVTASEAKLHFGDVLDHCVYGKKNIIIHKHGKPVAVMVEYHSFNSQKSEGKTIDETSLVTKMGKIANRVAGYKTSKKQVSAVDIVKTIRNERDKHRGPK